jgi:hypothetical protein
MWKVCTTEGASVYLNKIFALLYAICYLQFWNIFLIKRRPYSQLNLYMHKNTLRANLLELEIKRYQNSSDKKKITIGGKVH